MKNKLVPGILIGAVIGGVATLADKSTRDSLVQSFKDAKNGNRSRKPSKITNIKDEVLYWKDVVEEIRRNNPELERSLKDAKDTFVNRKNQR
ncbi:YtxH domain-containing protein [Staphylococcus simiae]|uniref:YtxH domain-containing protein n=1 Tax=Staphylococcus simiae TaxID=308354 RepID=UPI001A97B7A1|nr:YtxH domain-containing protein [Staphylococcus simiae]MBO1199482.1 YtxH domain-containing protein [Staphylococcus simiae]MBO1201914.1 YtxH domain-containing protein [Staphylococcus simiae]MBO1203976.1 YtxH domain-containing protein [Staphylococcus simiae]MBO1211488.1 YtxH domain-containing protein [Staphylococcus simiae]MBO1230363.1 YtxH domain-containing protein [Staphylococcus simiae]